MGRLDERYRRRDGKRTVRLARMHAWKPVARKARRAGSLDGSTSRMGTSAAVATRMLM